MGEIKSTLDLVLEKTRHLSQTSEEKQAQTLKNTEDRIKGYASAIFEIARGEAELERIVSELFQIARTLETSTDLRDALTDPRLPADALVDVVEGGVDLGRRDLDLQQPLDGAALFDVPRTVRVLHADQLTQGSFHRLV